MWLSLTLSVHGRAEPSYSRVKLPCRPHKKQVQWQTVLCSANYAPSLHSKMLKGLCFNKRQHLQYASPSVMLQAWEVRPPQARCTTGLLSPMPLQGPTYRRRLSCFLLYCFKTRLQRDLRLNNASAHPLSGLKPYWGFKQLLFKPL